MCPHALSYPLFTPPTAFFTLYLLSSGSMHTLWIRLNAVVFFSFSVLLALALLTSFTSTPLFLGDNGNPNDPLQPIVSHIEMAEMRSLRSHGGVDRALFSINLKVSTPYTQ